MQTLKNIGTWLKLHFDFALILAAAVEIPRWTVTFLAIHEPLWVGIPLGALLAYATSEGWKAYFVDTRRYKLLAFNVASLAAATFVITPVLFSMASAPIDEIDLAALLPSAWLLAWAGVLAVTTFAPLIQLAAVKSTPAEKPTNAITTLNRGTREIQAPVAPPVGTLGHQDATTAAGKPAVEPPKQPTHEPTPQPPSDVPTVDARTQALHLRDEGYTAAEIARMTGAKYSTVQSWLRRATVQTNGVHQ
jgi:hypothetical protein